MNLLSQTQIRSLAIADENSLVTLSHIDSISNALKTLAVEGVSSAPVIHTERMEWIGSVDTLDLMTYVLNVSRHKGGDYWVKEVHDRFSHPIIRAIDSSSNNPFYPVLETTALGEAISQFFSHGIHRLPVVASSSLSNVSASHPDLTISSIVSQTDVIRWLYDTASSPSLDPDIQSLKELCNKRIDLFDLVPGVVVSINQDSRLLTAFDVIIANNVNGIAIVNNDGEIVGNLSASDFKGFTQDNFYNLDVPIEKVIGSQHPITIKRDTTLMQTMGLLLSHKIHRVYIVDDRLSPIGIVSLTDIMQLVSKHFYGIQSILSK